MLFARQDSFLPYNVVFPSQFARLLIEYQEHPEAKSLAPDGKPCEAGTRGLLQRAHIVAGEFRYVGKETDRKWEEGDGLSLLEFKATEYGRGPKVVADTSVADEIRAIGIRKTMNLAKVSQHTIEKLVRGKTIAYGQLRPSTNPVSLRRLFAHFGPATCLTHGQ